MTPHLTWVVLQYNKAGYNYSLGSSVVNFNGLWTPWDLEDKMHNQLINEMRGQGAKQLWGILWTSGMEGTVRHGGSVVSSAGWYLMSTS